MLRNKLKYIFLIQLVIISMLLIGCWDKIEIDQRAFVLALGIDHIPPEERGGDDEPQEMATILNREENYRVTYVFPKQMMGVGGEPTVENILLSSTGDNIYSVERQIQTRTDSQLFVGHLKSVVIGEAVVKDPQIFREVLDALEKDPLISRKISLAVAKGEAKTVLEVQPKLEPITGQFISDLFQGRDWTNRAPLADLGEILTCLHNNGNVTIPRLVSTEDEVKMGGAAVIKNFEFVGWLGEAESIGLLIVRNEVELYTVTIAVDDVKIPYQVTETKSKLSFVDEGDQGLKMKVDIEMEGDIMQYLFKPKEDVLDPVFLEKLQEEINTRIHTATMYTIEKLQKEFETDVLGFDKYLRKHHPEVWARVGEDWVNVFPTIDVEVNVDAKIRRVGLSK